MEKDPGSARHVTADEVDRLCTGRLDAERLLEVSDHLRARPDCATRTAAAEARLAESWRQELTGEPDTGDHVTPEILAAFVNGTLGEADREVAGSHIAMCPICREDAADLYEVAIGGNLRHERQMSRNAIWAAIAVVVAALLLFVVVGRR